MKKTLLLFAMLIACQSKAQVYLMNDINVTTCAGMFYDSGGESANYATNQNFIKTFYPGVEGSSLRLEFSSFNAEDQSDILFVYDGDDISAPLIGGFTGGTLPPILQASGDNSTGALTFRFLSDGDTTMGGWAASISCQVPCQVIESVLISTQPSADPEDGLIKVCPGTSVAFNGTAVFANSGEDATYVWVIDGVEIPGQNITYTFENGGAFQIFLKVTDGGGCNSTNSLNTVVQASIEPNVTFSSETNEYNIFSVEADATPVTFYTDCVPPIADVTFLPDGSGASYQSSIVVGCYDTSAVLSSAGQLLSVCLNMEHSFIGDLSISLVSPNGQSVILKAFDVLNNTGNYLGEPIDEDNGTPGIGYTYCFTLDAETLLDNGPLAPTGVGQTIVAGDYLPWGTFNSLVGSPLNGVWTILVTDNQPVDDGYIFNWTMAFSPELLPEALVFESSIAARGWMASDYIISQTETNVFVGSPDPGEQCFTYFVTDNIGCTYYYDQCVTLEALGVNELPTSNSIIVFPSPANDSFGISGLGRLNTASTLIKVTDVSGKLLKTFTPSESYDISGLQSGLYFVTVSDAQGSVVRRLVKS